jgi:hypothetical protein
MALSPIFESSISEKLIRLLGTANIDHLPSGAALLSQISL